MTDTPMAEWDAVVPSAGDGEPSNRPPPAIRVVQNWYEEFRDREQN